MHTAHTRQHALPRHAAIVAASLLALSCADSPTAVIDVAGLEGFWEMNLRANTACHVNAIARKIGFSLDTIDLGDGQVRFNGIWADGPTAVGAHYYDATYAVESREVEGVFVHWQTLAGFALEGRFTSNERFEGTVRPPDGREYVWSIDACAQAVVGRKVGDYPAP